MTGPIETEIKIRMPEGAESARRLIESYGYRITEPRTLQVDQVFDFPDGSLRQGGRLLRVRSQSEPGHALADGPARQALTDGPAILTYKGPAAAGVAHKSREELETPAASRATLELILNRLGFVPSFRYEKYRTTFRLPPGAITEIDGDGAGLIALDETPIGVFIELEGAGYWIDRVAADLGFMPKDYVTASYAALYREYLTTHTGTPDMVFLRKVLREQGKDS